MLTVRHPVSPDLVEIGSLNKPELAQDTTTIPVINLFVVFDAPTTH